MEPERDIMAALVETLRTIDAQPDVPISLFDIGVPMVGQGFEQLAIVDTLYAAQERGLIQLLDGNRLVLRGKL